MNDHPLDQRPVPESFLAHLQERLGLRDEAAAASTLGDWICGYQPGPAALARATPKPERRRSAA